MAAQHNFASPAYWHIQALVGDLRADNAAEALSELEHVFSLYGEDARAFALSQLVPLLDASRPKSLPKLSPKASLARQLIIGLATKPNFVSLLARALQTCIVESRTCRALGVPVPDKAAAGSLSDGMLDALCEALLLPQPVQVAVGLGLAFVSSTAVATAAFRFVRARVRLYSAASPAADRLPFAVFHPLLFLLRTHPASLAEPKDTNDLIARLHSAHPNAIAAVPALPVIQGPVALVDTLTLPAQGEAARAASSDTEVATMLLHWGRSEDAAAARAAAEGAAAIGPTGARRNAAARAASSSSTVIQSAATSDDAAERAAAAVAELSRFGPRDAGALAPLAGLVDDVVGVVLDLGPGCSRSPAAFRAALAVAGRGPSSGSHGKGLRELSPDEAAALLVGMANADAALSAAATGPPLSGSAVSSFLTATVRSPEGREGARVASSASSWGFSTVCAVLSADHPRLDWRAVARAIDMPAVAASAGPTPEEGGAASAAGPIATQEAFAAVASAIAVCSRKPFPAEVLLERWHNAHAQLAALRFAVEAPADVVSFAQVPALMEPLANSEAGSGTANQAWCAVGLYRSLVRLAHAGGLQPACLEVVKQGQKRAPELLLLGLAHARAEAGEAQSGEDIHVLRGRMYEALLSSSLGPAISAAPTSKELGAAERRLLRQSAAAAPADLSPSALQVELLKRLIRISPALAVNSVVHLAVVLSQASDRRQAAAIAEASKSDRAAAAVAEVSVGSADDPMRALGCFVTRGVAFLRMAGMRPREVVGNLHTVSALAIAAASVLVVWGPGAGTPAAEAAEASAAVDEALTAVLAQDADASDRAARAIATTLSRFAGASTSTRSDSSLPTLFSADCIMPLFRPLREAAARLSPDLRSSIRSVFDSCLAADPGVARAAEDEDLDEADKFLSRVFSRDTTVAAAVSELRALVASDGGPGGARHAPAMHGSSPQRLVKRIVSSLFDEQANFHGYPLPELLTVAELMAGMISAGLVAGPTARTALTTAHSALARPIEKPEEVSMAKFAVWFTAAALPVLAELPEAALSIASLPLLRSHVPPLPELAAALHAAASPGMEAILASRQPGASADFRPPDGKIFRQHVARGRDSVSSWTGDALARLGAAVDKAVAGGLAAPAPQGRFAPKDGQHHGAGPSSAGFAPPSSSTPSSAVMASAPVPATSSASSSSGLPQLPSSMAATSAMSGLTQQSGTGQPGSGAGAGAGAGAGGPARFGAPGQSLAQSQQHQPAAQHPMQVAQQGRSFADKVSTIVAQLTSGSFIDLPDHGGPQSGLVPPDAPQPAPSAARREASAKQMRAVLTALANEQPVHPDIDEHMDDTDDGPSAASGAGAAADDDSTAAGDDGAAASAAASSRPSLPQPANSVTNSVNFALNNLDKSSIHKAVQAISDLAAAGPAERAWLAEHVNGRACNEPQHAEIIRTVLTMVKPASVIDDVRAVTVEHVCAAMAKPGPRTNSKDRTRIKNLGTFLGQLTLAMDRPLLARELDLRSLILEAYETGRLVSVVQFVVELLKSSKNSRVFTLSNPWMRAIFCLLREISEVPFLKLIVLFAIEVLFRDFEAAVTDFPSSDLLRFRRKPEVKGNPDFLETATPESVPGLTGGQSETADELAKSARLAVIPGLSRLVSVPLGLGIQEAVDMRSLRNAAITAVNATILEVVRSVTERESSVAVATTQCLVDKDFAADSSQKRMSAAASLMAAHLAGALAQAKSLEVIPRALEKRVRLALVTARNVQSAKPGSLDQATRAIEEANRALCCALVEQAAMAKASTDAVAALHPQLDERAAAAEHSIPLREPTLPIGLPSELTVSRDGLSQRQLDVYRSFDRSIATGSSRASRGVAGSGPATASAGSMAAPGAAGRGMPYDMHQAGRGGAPHGAAQGARPAQLDGHEALQEARSILQKLIKDARERSAVGIGDLPPSHTIFNSLRSVATLPARLAPSVRLQLTGEVARVVFLALVELAASPLPRQTLLVALMILRRSMHMQAMRDLCVDVAGWLSRLAPAAARSVPFLAALVAGKLVKTDQLDAAVADMASKREATPSGKIGPSVTLAAALLYRVCVIERLAEPTDFARTAAAIAEEVSHVPGGEASPQMAVVNALEAISAGRDPMASISASMRMELEAMDPKIAPGTIIAGPADAAPRSERQQVGAPLEVTEEVRTLVLKLLERWVQIWHEASSGRATDRMFHDYMQMLTKQKVLKSDTALERFVRVTITLCVQSCAAKSTLVPAEAASPETSAAGNPRTRLTYLGVDALSKLVVLLLKASATAGDKLATLSKVLDVSARTLLLDAEANAGPGGPFDQRPYLRLFSNLMHDVILPRADAEVNAASARYSIHVLTAFCNTLHSLRPTRLACFALAWQALASHRALLARLIAAPAHAGWPLLRRLLVDQLRFLSVVCRAGVGSRAARVVYKGVLRTVLGIVHDAPEFLADHHHWVCEVLPPSCMQLRNLVLSAFPNRMRLPDPFTPALKVDQLEPMASPPRIVGDPAESLPSELRELLDTCLAAAEPAEAVAPAVADLLRSSPEELRATGARFSWSRVSAFVLTVGIRTVGSESGASIDVPSTPGFGLLRALLDTLEADGRYLLLSAIANQLRYPNSHTHLFSMATLLLFQEARDDAIKEQLTRVLLERLIVCRPHPWGLLITYIELIKQRRYRFWEHSFTRSSPDILQLLEKVAQSCLVTKPEA